MTREMFEFFAIAAVVCVVIATVMDAELLPMVWRHNRAWAEHRKIPAHFLDRFGNHRWMGSLMLFDPSIQVTPAARVLAVIDGCCCHGFVISMVMALSTAIFRG
jgi:hypothetical protein